jgi:hypothetical protein
MSLCSLHPIAGLFLVGVGLQLAVVLGDLGPKVAAVRRGQKKRKMWTDEEKNSVSVKICGYLCPSSFLCFTD